MQYLTVQVRKSMQQKSKGDATAVCMCLPFTGPTTGLVLQLLPRIRKRVRPGRHRATSPNATLSLLRLRPSSALADLGHTGEVRALTGCYC